MNTCGRFLTSALLTLAIANHAFAATATPAAAQDVKPAASQAAPAAAPSATTAAPGTAASPATTAPGAAIAPGTAGAPAATAPTSAAVPRNDQIKIGYIDMDKIAMESSSGKAAAESMKAKSTKLRTKIEARQKQLEKQKAALEAKADTMSAKERAAKGKEFQKKVEEYQKLVRSSEQEMGEMQEKLRGDIMKSVKKAATSYAKSHGYTAIVDERAVLYMSDSVEPKDISSEVAAAMDQQKKSK